jgi:probable addiction module antidote protein
VATKPLKKEILKKQKNTYKYGRKTIMYKHSVPLEGYLIEKLQDKEMAKEFLNVSLENLLEDGDIKAFLNSLELVVKSRQSLLSFAKEANLSRSNLYGVFKGEKKPQLNTVLKILSKLGYSLKVA